LSSIQVQEVDATGALVYNSAPLAPSTATHSFTNAFAWTNLTALRFLYADNLGNSYIITYPTVVVTTPAELSVVNYSSSSLVLAVEGQAGHGYRIQFHLTWQTGAISPRPTCPRRQSS
jgi:hypothetical protein